MTAAFHTLDNGQRLAYRQYTGNAARPGVVFLPGHRSDFTGGKAEAVWQWCQAQQRSCLQFDYRGHGQSDGDFTRLGISDWVSDASVMLEKYADASSIIIGSSMGGWIMLHLALQQPDKIHALVGISAAPDFTETLLWNAFTAQQRTEITGQGYTLLPDPFDTDSFWTITRAFIDDGRPQCVLNSDLLQQVTVPVRLLHGMQDSEVPWQTALTLTDALGSQDVRVHLVKDADHRLSREQDIRCLLDTLAGL